MAKSIVSLPKSGLQIKQHETRLVKTMDNQAAAPRRKLLVCPALS